MNRPTKWHRDSFDARVPAPVARTPPATRYSRWTRVHSRGTALPIPLRWRLKQGGADSEALSSLLVKGGLLGNCIEAGPTTALLQITPAHEDQRNLRQKCDRLFLGALDRAPRRTPGQQVPFLDARQPEIW